MSEQIRIRLHACIRPLIWYYIIMSVKPPLVRTALSPQERAWRSKLTQLTSGQPFLRGTLLERERVCGKPNCRCARGQKHRSLYVVVSDGKRQRQLFVPKDWEDRIRQWVTNHKAIRELIHEVSDLYWAKARRRQE